MTPQCTLPKRTPQRSHITSERAQKAYNALYTLLVAQDVNLRSMKLQDEPPLTPLISLGGVNVTTAEKLIEALEQPPSAARPSKEVDSPEEAES